MKKIFETPVISISEFDIENIVTTSGTTGTTAENEAQSALAAAEGKGVSLNDTVTFAF